MQYSEKDYESDLDNQDMPHIESRDRFQAFYDALGEGPARQVGYPKHRMGWVSIKHPATILELGCHNGYNLIHWAEENAKTSCVGIDISRPLIEIARQRILQAELGSRVTVEHSFIEDYESDREFSDVVLTETLEHVQDASEVLCAAVKLTVPGARLWITVPSYRWGNYSHVRGIRAATLASMLQDCGIDVSEILRIDEREIQGESLTRCLVIRQS